VHVIEMYRLAAARAVEVADGIQVDQLSSETPCVEWTEQDVLDHLVAGTVGLAVALGAEPAAPPALATAADLDAGFQRCLAQMAVPANLELRSRSPLGFEWSGGEATAGTAMDVLVHTWDLAVATGQPPELHPEVVDACVAMFLPMMPEAGRAAGIIGPAVEVPADAPAQDRLLASLGRTP
jgi:uncharacterized protein (TIGR03086 family)